MPLQYLDNDENVPMALMASAETVIEAKALAQARVLASTRPFLRALGGDLLNMVLTPDLHPGADTPVGLAFESKNALIPGAIGNDIGCGISMVVFDVDARSIDESTRSRIGARLRHLFFEGGRDLPLAAADREAIFEYGLTGLFASAHVRAGAGLWQLLDGVDTTTLSVIDAPASVGVNSRMLSWARTSGLRDAQLGSLGGGNHFCELQEVAEIVDGPQAWAWGVRAHALALMTHSGSLGFGHLASATYEHTRPPNWKLPTVLLPLAESEANPYLQAMTNAAAFARANRLALTLMSAAAVRSELGDGINFSVVGDSPHNLIWQREQRFLHRKGACAADFSTPVFIPGSMGDSSWLLVGGGNEESLSSSAHGAGRLLSRGAAAHYKTAKGKNERLGGDANADIHVITPADPLRLLHSGRRDLLRERERRLREEAPRAYKPVETVVDSVVTADAAKGVARMRPILTIKA